MSRPLAMILHASGANRDGDAAQALQLAGAQAEIVHLNALRRGSRRLAEAQILVLPGGFSYGDALGAGRLMALDLQTYLADALREFVSSGKPVIGICNGFQALVKAGVLPGWEDVPGAASLVNNECGHFVCRWVRLLPDPESTCLWTRGLTEIIECPVAHGEGRFVLRSLPHPPSPSPQAERGSPPNNPSYSAAPITTISRSQSIERLTTDSPSPLTERGTGGEVNLLHRLIANHQIALTYIDDTNPNGSTADIAGICNGAGNVLGLMPHPEDHVYTWQHPQHTRPDFPGGGLGLHLFKVGVSYVEGKSYAHG